MHVRYVCLCDSCQYEPYGIIIQLHTRNAFDKRNMLLGICVWRPMARNGIEGRHCERNSPRIDAGIKRQAGSLIFQNWTVSICFHGLVPYLSFPSLRRRFRIIFTFDYLTHATPPLS